MPLLPNTKIKMVSQVLLRSCWILALLLSSLAPNSHAFAHMTSMGQMVIEIKPKKKSIHILLSLSTVDVWSYLKLDHNKNKKIETNEIVENRDYIRNYLKKNIIVSNQQNICFVQDEKLKKNSLSRRRLLMLLIIQCEKSLQSITIENTILFGDTGGYKHFARIQLQNRITTTVFSRFYPKYDIDIPKLLRNYQKRKKIKKQPPPKKSPAPPSSNPNQDLLSIGYWKIITRYLPIGVEHILFGFDHILFVLTLLLAASRFRKLFFVITAFTIGHSFALLLSSLHLIQISTNIIEPLIALSIVYTASENYLTLDKPKFRPILTFLFGLIHGVGFSYILQNQIKLPVWPRLSALLGFNLGVELGQLLIVLLFLPILLLLWKYSESKIRQVGLKTANIIIFMIAVTWFFQRTFF